MSSDIQVPELSDEQKEAFQNALKARLPKVVSSAQENGKLAAKEQDDKLASKEQAQQEMLQRLARRGERKKNQEEAKQPCAGKCESNMGTVVLGVLALGATLYLGMKFYGYMYSGNSKGEAPASEFP